MQTDSTDRIQAETASQSKQILSTLDPDIQALILGWVVLCLIDNFLNRHRELKLERPMQSADSDLTPLIGADGSRKGSQL